MVVGSCPLMFEVAPLSLAEAVAVVVLEDEGNDLIKVIKSGGPEGLGIVPLWLSSGVAHSLSRLLSLPVWRFETTWLGLQVFSLSFSRSKNQYSAESALKKINIEMFKGPFVTTLSCRSHFSNFPCRKGQAGKRTLENMITIHD